MVLFSIGLTVFLVFRKKTPVRILTADSDYIPYDPEASDKKEADSDAGKPDNTENIQ